MKTPWIGRPDAVMLDWRSDVLPAPLFRSEFRLNDEVKGAEVKICGLGFYELRMNGEKVGSHVLDPIVTQYDQRVRYVAYDVTDRLRTGSNTVGVMLGNGWYNCFTAEVWHFDKASWRDYPKLWLELTVQLSTNERVNICSSPDWKVGDGPLRFDGLRNGEIYDARLERPGWDCPGYDDSDWANAVAVPGPGGIMEEQKSPPCKVTATLTPESVTEIRPGVAVYDMGQNFAGWAQLRIQGGKAGDEVVLRYSENLKDNGEVDQSNIARFIRSGECQTDRYIMKGDAQETWEPRFTYHGFRYVQLEGLPGAPEIDHIRGRMVHTAFNTIGGFECSNNDLNKLQQATQWSYISNFVGIPTDCPHREKNGWTGDAQLATETGLINYDATDSYQQWLDSLSDTQRPNGQLSGIAPSCGWGYNWGSGPAWDAAFILIPWYIYLYTGDCTAIEKHYESMRRYLGFCNSMATEHILSFGLGDWCPVNADQPVSVALTSTAYYYVFTEKMAAFARLTGQDSDAAEYEELAAHIRTAFNDRFYKGNGLYDRGQMTARGCAIYQGLVEESEKATTVKTLADDVESNDYRVDFGILGAKYVPRALADNGYVEHAYRLITQPEYPGWANWLRKGATTLWEKWDGTTSRNHIMFGDISSWFYTYLGGIQPDPSKPGFRHIRLQPCTVAGLDWVRSWHRSPQGVIESRWVRDNDRAEFVINIPPASTGTLVLPDRQPQVIGSGQHQITVKAVSE